LVQIIHLNLYKNTFSIFYEIELVLVVHLLVGKIPALVCMTYMGGIAGADCRKLRKTQKQKDGNDLSYEITSYTLMCF
jgi:hypothetical protein